MNQEHLKSYFKGWSYEVLFLREGIIGEDLYNLFHNNGFISQGYGESVVLKNTTNSFEKAENDMNFARGIFEREGMLHAGNCFIKEEYFILFPKELQDIEHCEMFRGRLLSFRGKAAAAFLEKIYENC
jgi:hypothetical protein